MTRLPQLDEYRDTGCEVAPACLSCPLPVCRYDSETGVRGIVNAERNDEMAQMKAEGWTAKRIAEHFGVTVRTVHYVLSRQ